MNSESIFELSRERVVGLLQNLSLEFESDAETDELQAIAYSYISGDQNFDTVYELSLLFKETFELVRSIIDSSNNCVTENVFQQLMELQPQCSENVHPVFVSRHHDNFVESIRPNKALVGHAIVAVESENRSETEMKSWSIKSTQSSEIDETGGCVQRITCPDMRSISSTSSPTSAHNNSIVLNLDTFGLYDYNIELVRTVRPTSSTLNNDDLLLTSEALHDSMIPPTVPITETKTVSRKVFVSSPTYEYVSALDSMFDTLHWAWEPVHFNEELEHALYELLVSVSEELVQMVRNWKNMMKSFGNGTSGDDMEQMLEMIQNDVRLALVDHNAYSIGRLHQTLTQFTENSSMMQIPMIFTNAVNKFIEAKLKATDNKIIQLVLMKLIIAAKLYHDQLDASNHSEKQKLANFLSNFPQRLHEIETLFGGADKLHTAIMSYDSDAKLRSLLQTEALFGLSKEVIMVDESTGDVVHIDRNVASETTHVLTVAQVQAIVDLKPKPLEMIMNSSVSVWNNRKLTYMATIPMEILSDSGLLDRVVQQQSETLFSEVLNINSMMGFEIRHTENLALSCALIIQLLEAGLTYVTSESGKVMAMFPTKRSVLRLYCDDTTTGISPPPVVITTKSKSGKKQKPTPLAISNTRPTLRLPIQLAKRLHEMPRIFRQKVKQNLSLRLNTNIPLAIEKLREHHGADCWVGSELEAVWHKMASTTPLKLLIFELYYGEELIAADFGHPTNDGLSIYIATRFFNRNNNEIKVMMPGFLLALVECKVLKDLGCMLWDLGGVNSCPLMRYKLDLTGTPVERPEALYEHRKCKKQATENRQAEWTKLKDQFASERKLSQDMTPTAVAAASETNSVVMDSMSTEECGRARVPSGMVTPPVTVLMQPPHMTLQNLRAGVLVESITLKDLLEYSG